MKKKLTNVEVILIVGSIIKLLGLIYRIFLTRILSIEGMRLMSLVFPTLSLVLCLSSLSMSTVVNQNIAAKINQSRTVLKSAFRITFISSSVISIVLLFSFPIYKIIYQNSFVYYPLLICIPLIYLSNTSGIIKGYLEANNHFKATYYSNFFEQIAKFLFTFSMLFFFRNYSLEIKVLCCFLAMMLSEIISFSYLVYKIKRKRKFHYLETKTNGYEKKILKQALPLTLEQLIMTITGYLEPLLFYSAIQFYGSNLYDATIYYTKVTSYAIPLLIFAHFGVLSVAKFTFPKITKNKNSSALNLILSKSIFICLIIATFNLIVCSFYAKDMLQWMYGDSASYEIAKNLAPFYFFFYFNPIFIIILQAYNKEKKLLLSSIISSSILLILVFTLTYFFGFTGFLISIICGSSIKFLLLFFFANQCVSFKLKWSHFVPLMFFLVLYFLINYLWQSILCLFISTIFGGLTALVLYYLFYCNKKAFGYGKKHK